MDLWDRLPSWNHGNLVVVHPHRHHKGVSNGWVLVGSCSNNLTWCWVNVIWVSTMAYNVGPIHVAYLVNILYYL